MRYLWTEEAAHTSRARRQRKQVTGGAYLGLPFFVARDVLEKINDDVSLKSWDFPPFPPHTGAREDEVKDYQKEQVK